MAEMQPIVTDVHSICQSYRSAQLHCAKTAEQIKGPRNIVFNGGPDPLHGGGWGHNCEVWDPLVFPEQLKTRNCVCTSRGGGPNKNYAKVGHRGSGMRS